MSKREYFAAADGFILGAHRKKGDPCGLLSVAEAKYPAMSGLITATKPKAADNPKRSEPSPVDLDKKTR